MSGVQTIQRAFALLRALAVGPAGVTELADHTGLPKSTVARLLNALETEEAVQQLEAGGRYSLGHGLIELAGTATPDRTLIAAARPFLTALTDETGETSGIAVLDEWSVRYLDHVQSGEEVQVRDWTGELAPLNVVPSGLVLLAGQPEADVDRYLAGALSRNTDRSVTDPDAIRARLETARSVGWVWGYAEFDESINSVAAGVVDASGRTVAAIHIHGPAYRFPDPGRDRDIGRLVKDAARGLSARLGRSGPSE